DTMAWEKAFRRSGRFMVITATPASISARRSSVPVSIAVMSPILAGEADPANHPWPPTHAFRARGAPVPRSPRPFPLHWQSGDGHLGDSLATTTRGWHEPQPLAPVGQFYRGVLVAGLGDPEHRCPAP